LKFLEAINLTYAIISSGATYSKFPNATMLERLYSIVPQENVYTTETNGTIWLRSDGDNIKFEFLDYNLDGANRTSFLENIYNVLFLFAET